MNCQFYLDFLLYFNISYHLTYDFIYQGSHTHGKSWNCLVLLESLLSYRILPKQVLYCLFVEHIHQYLYNTQGSIKQMHYNNTISFLTACSQFVTKIVYFPNSRSISVLFLLEIVLKTSWILLEFCFLFCVATLYIIMGDYFSLSYVLFTKELCIYLNLVCFFVNKFHKSEISAFFLSIPHHTDWTFSK